MYVFDACTEMGLNAAKKPDALVAGWCISSLLCWYYYIFKDFAWRASCPGHRWQADMEYGACSPAASPVLSLAEMVLPAGKLAQGMIDSRSHASGLVRYFNNSLFLSMFLMFIQAWRPQCGVNAGCPHCCMPVQNLDNLLILLCF